ncbi:biotin--[acetyl-CoA-carboxylase] ligase [Jeotgalibacillus terrae]|uniref:Bifunctional ligase/repressor BirA n=1 Tax=Jeotgalibacillus terrae TaxID=587735 RepID=A0ABW5ZMZ0_9BACL|nr:biotin--[acetyl-CoA-carboxylase] ligase [Jeotgalibacillus terrae]MBM7577412.1 BirA family biotin operon repressor/biotin-[acetyl-CoA-carboxylase] ligase [Jeotgalibacillus terrae]
MASKIRESILHALSSEEDSYFSGQELADKAGCSRTAIWKHIEDLRSSGFLIESKRKKGYRLIGKADELNESNLLVGLKTSVLGRKIHYYESVESTQKIAHALAQEEAPEGTLVIAEEQISGRGRMARSWYSPKGTGIWMSLLLRPALPPQKAPQFTLIMAVAVVEAIQKVCDLQVDIKWPNDLLIKGKKITGILTELQADSEQIHSLIIGTGINVNQSESDFSEEIRHIATSLKIESGQTFSRAEIVQEILKNLERYYDVYIKEGFEPVKEIWEQYAVTIGKHITARTINKEISGYAAGITNEGVLKLIDETGKTHLIYSADIE